MWTGLFIVGSGPEGEAALSEGGPSNGETLVEVADATPAQGMAVLDAAVIAASHSPFTDEEILAAAREHAVTTIDALLAPTSTSSVRASRRVD